MHHNLVNPLEPAKASVGRDSGSMGVATPEAGRLELGVPRRDEEGSEPAGGVISAWGSAK